MCEQEDMRFGSNNNVLIELEDPSRRMNLTRMLKKGPIRSVGGPAHLTYIFRLLAIEFLIAPLMACVLAPPVSGQSLDEGHVNLPSLISQGSLDPHLPREFTRLKFSPDGNFILAQDSSTIFVLTRQPMAEHFRIDASGAGPAQFTPDSSEVVFSTGGVQITIERWSVPKGQRTSAHKVVLVGDCIETLLSPDGKSLACFSEHISNTARLPPFRSPVGLKSVDFELIDVSSGDAIAAKKDFISGSIENVEFLSDAQKMGQLVGSGLNSAIPAHFSPDGRYFVASYDKDNVGVDLGSRAIVPLHGDLNSILGGGFTFISPVRVLVENMHDPAKSEVLEFPSGKVISTVALGNQQIEAATRGNRVFLRPIKAAPVGVFDWESQRMVTALAEPTGVDLYDNYMISQLPDGQIGLSNLVGAKVESKVALPPGDLGSLDVASVSTDIRWLAASTPTRGAVWDLSTKQHYLLRSFSGSYFDGDDAFYADFPKRGDTPRSIVRVDLSAINLKPVHPIDESSLETKQYGRILLSKLPAGKTRWEFSLAVQDARDGQILWTRRFPELTPGDIEVSPDQNRVIFRWLAEQKPAMDEIRNDKGLKARYDKIAEHISTYLFQVMEADTGKGVGDVLVETPFTAPVGHVVQTPPPTAFACGDWLFVTVDPEQTRIYSISGGDLRTTVPGSIMTASASAGLFVLGTKEGDLQVYMLPDAEKRAHLTFPSATKFVRFSGDGRRMFVLSQGQGFYVFDAETLARSAVARPPQ